MKPHSLSLANRREFLQVVGCTGVHCAGVTYHAERNTALLTIFLDGRRQLRKPYAKPVVNRDSPDGIGAHTKKHDCLFDAEMSFRGAIKCNTFCASL